MFVAFSIALVTLCALCVYLWFLLQLVRQKLDIIGRQCAHIQSQLGLISNALKANVKDHVNLRETIITYIEDMNQKYVRKNSILAEIKRAASAEKRD